MTIFQKLFWFKQMGIDGFCSEVKGLPLKKEKSVPQKEDAPSFVSKTSLSKTATHTLWGTGVQQAKVLCLLNAPNSEEDRTGIYLAGPEGEMTKKMLLSIGLDIRTNTYLTYLSPWRPPGNRLLTAVEVKEGMDLLKKHLEQIHPTFVFVFGAETLRNLLPGKTLSSLRSSHATFEGYPVYATFSASALIKTPAHRRQTWEDLKRFKERMEE